MTEQEHPLPPENRVQFQLNPGDRLEVALTADGHVTLYLGPAPRPDEASPSLREPDTAPLAAGHGDAEAPASAPWPDAATEAATPVPTTAPLAAGEDEEHPEATPPVPTETAGKVEQVRRTVHGRVGAAPSFWTTGRGVQVAHFPLASHDADETAWLHALAFYDPSQADERKRTRAQRLFEQVRQHVDTGQEVTVVGYPHERTVRRGDAISTQAQLYLTALRHHHPPEPPDRSTPPSQHA